MENIKAITTHGGGVFLKFDTITKVSSVYDPINISVSHNVEALGKSEPTRSQLDTKFTKIQEHD